MDDRNRCPNCGKYQDDDPQGYFAPVNPGAFDPYENPLEVFCNKSCADQYAVKQLPDEPQGNLKC